MMFALSSDDLDLIAKLEIEFDPATYWADSLVREWMPATDWKTVCDVERARLKRAIRWAVVFRDMEKLDKEFGAIGHNPEPFREAFYEIVDEGGRVPLAPSREPAYDELVARFLGGEHRIGQPKADAWEALFETNPTDGACKRILGGFLTHNR